MISIIESDESLAEDNLGHFEIFRLKGVYYCLFMLSFSAFTDISSSLYHSAKIHGKVSMVFHGHDWPGFDASFRD